MNIEFDDRSVVLAREALIKKMEYVARVSGKGLTFEMPVLGLSRVRRGMLDGHARTLAIPRRDRISDLCDRRVTVDLVSP